MYYIYKLTGMYVLLLLYYYMYVLYINLYLYLYYLYIIYIQSINSSILIISVIKS